MKTFSTLVQYVKDIEKKDKLTVAEEVYNAVVKDYNERIAKLRKAIENAENNATALLSQKYYSFHEGMWAAYNMVADEKDHLKTIIEPSLDKNGQPMWLEELKHRVEG